MTTEDMKIVEAAERQLEFYKGCDDMQSGLNRRGVLDNFALRFPISKVREMLEEIEQLKAELPDWLIDDKGRCRAVECFDECPAYDYACRLRAEGFAGDEIEKLKSSLAAALERERELQREVCHLCARFSKLECGEAYADIPQEIAQQRGFKCFESEGE